MRKFNIIWALRGTTAQPIYHLSLFPVDFPGGAIPAHDYTTFGGFVTAASRLGFEKEMIAGINADLIRDGKSIVLQHEISDETATEFGWPKP